MKIQTNTVYHNSELNTWFYLTVWPDGDPAYRALNLRYSFKKPAQLTKPENYTCMSNFANLQQRTDSMLRRLGVVTAKIALDVPGEEYEIGECTTSDPVSSQD